MFITLVQKINIFSLTLIFFYTDIWIPVKAKTFASSEKGGLWFENWAEIIGIWIKISWKSAGTWMINTWYVLGKQRLNP